MGGDAFSENSLTERLTKLNSSQQSIESLSRWCISHRKKAKQIVETWRAVFTSVSQERRVSLLYLANDILQISRRKGAEFVNEFWKVLPVALKGVYNSGEESCKKVASRLVDIWADRKVFGSKGQNLKNELTGKNSSPLGKNPAPVNVGNDVNPIKVLKRDANSLRIKLAVGGVPEKILTAFQLVLDEIGNEEEALNECRNAVFFLRDKDNDVNASSLGNLLVGSDVLSDIQKQEDTVQKSITQLEKIEATRVSLVSQLREALKDQESKLELVQSELLTARSQIEKTANTKLHLTLISSTPPPTVNQAIVEPSYPPAPTPAQAQPTNNPIPGPPAHQHTSFAKSTISEEESNRATAAAVAARLTASTSSAQMLSSVLSSLVAEEAQAMKRPKLELPSDGNNHNHEVGNQLHFQAPFPPLPPPPWGNFPVSFGRPGPPPQQSQVHVSGGYYGQTSVGFYGQGHQLPAPPAPANEHQ